MQVLTFAGGCLIGCIFGIISTLVAIGMWTKNADDYFENIDQNHV